ADEPGVVAGGRGAFVVAVVIGAAAVILGFAPQFVFTVSRLIADLWT
ncbi:MAG: hypothetical protein QOJ50_2867, partial [Cryptosporangiaceae bacterium]|nr:hypothetical protein [Cryptosporangiaceae bacterium]